MRKLNLFSICFAIIFFMPLAVHATPVVPPGYTIETYASGTLKEKILYIIQTSPAGISKKEICNKLSLSDKQVSNLIYKLKEILTN